MLTEQYDAAIESFKGLLKNEETQVDLVSSKNKGTRYVIQKLITERGTNIVLDVYKNNTSTSLYFYNGKEELLVRKEISNPNISYKSRQTAEKLKKHYGIIDIKFDSTYELIKLLDIIDDYKESSKEEEDLKELICKIYLLVSNDRSKAKLTNLTEDKKQNNITFALGKIRLTLNYKNYTLFRLHSEPTNYVLYDSSSLISHPNFYTKEQKSEVQDILGKVKEILGEEIVRQIEQGVEVEAIKFDDFLGITPNNSSIKPSNKKNKPKNEVPSSEEEEGARSPSTSVRTTRNIQKITQPLLAHNM